MTKSPARKSPVKKSQRKPFRPTLWLSLTAPANAPSESEPQPSKVGEELANERFWLPQDIFKDVESEPSQDQEALNVDGSLGEQDGGDAAEYPDPDEVEEALDEEAIDTQLDGAFIEEQRDSGAEPAPKPYLRTHYIEYLLAAKAPRHLDERCVNHDCGRKLNHDSSAIQLWRCASCYGGRVLCTACIVQSHQYQPFHEVHGYIHHQAAYARTPKRWNLSLPVDFGYFKRLSLQEAGLQVGLGHDGDLCPKTSTKDCFSMTIGHINGQHPVTFRDCCCEGKPRWQLLLEYNIFPATDDRPQTGFTIEMLEHQRAFSLRGKTSLHEYYQAIVDLTNAAEGRVLKGFSYAYDQLRECGRQHRGLSSHIRAGRNDATIPLKNGELCVTCPACPQPGVNLPANWEQDPLKQLHYVRFLCGDGNFKLQRLAKRRSARSDPLVQESMFGDGSFWAPQNIHDTYLSETSMAADEPKGGQRNACNTMAGDPAISPEGSQAVDLTGVFCVSCRHIVVCPNGVVDFYKGERFRPVDVAFSGPLNASYQSGLRYFTITYDIACKYGVNFKNRCFDEDAQKALVPTPNGDMFAAFCVNKFHQESHEETCSAKNALNYTKFVGRTCGEGVETIWAKLNWVRYSTREMSAGGRREVLSEHLNDWNWQKTIGIVDSIRTAYLKALEAFAGVTERLEDLKMSLGLEAVAKLEERYGSSGGEQFLEDRDGLKWLSRNDLLVKMREVEGRTSHGATTEARQNVSQVDFICKALQLEQMQAKLRQRAHDISRLGTNASPRMISQMTNLHNRLQTRLQQHYDELAEIAPQLSQAGHQIRPDAPQSDEILLPSRLSVDEINSLGLRPLLQIEMQLRVGHAYDSIGSLKKALSLRSFWTRHVKAQYSSQTRRTKGQASLRSCQARVKEGARAYTTCYEWLIKCAPDMAQDFGLQKLRNQDLMLLSEYLEQQHYRHNGRQLSWIWTLKPKASQMDEDDEEENSSSGLDAVIEGWQNEFVRLEYVHARAAVDRWNEEVRILECEMAAVVRWFERRAMTWSRKCRTRADGAGYKAYTCRQFSLYQVLADHALDVFTEIVGGQSAWDAIYENRRTTPSTSNIETMDLD
ncbi:hypothetical protein M407DRAFT_30707 [Tulasnella calospora MUT 4182]|uniref:CxC2-like cysteine cluster KDZ transposase-associated domain-containing protein n=1 Tax=Tulasnella calospora MUT 4182 TaxID=1051891 RepID=A0A0C3Q6W4_9AGAM|nr:hypothetical protein M407DRAFT_30707 [Tulasnella calospora MUT 4182]